MYMSILFMRELLPDEDGYTEQELKLTKNIQEIKKYNVFQILERNLNHKVYFILKLIKGHRSSLNNNSIDSIFGWISLVKR